MKIIKARYNCGYWIWDCPVCDAGNRLKPGNPMGFCGGCYPNKYARKEAVYQGVILRGYDKEKQDDARRLAWANDEVYKISFPRSHKGIEKALRYRKEEHQSWVVGQSISDLEIENATHPELDYLKIIEEEPEPEPKPEPKVLPELDEKTLRRIN